MTHKLHATASELQAARNSWPWLSKTLSSIKEAANKRDVIAPGVVRRESAPGGEMRHTLHSQSRDNLKEVVWWCKQKQNIERDGRVVVIHDTELIPFLRTGTVASFLLNPEQKAATN